MNLAEAGIVSLKSQMEACNIQLCEAENRLSSRQAELQQLELKLVDTQVLCRKLCNKIHMMAAECSVSQLLFSN